MLNKTKEKFKEILKLGRPPWEMAAALSLGALIGLSPFLGFHIILAVALSSVLKLPVVITFLSTHISNPLTMPIYYPFAVKFGNFVLHKESHSSFDWHHISIKSLLTAGQELILPFFTGTGLIAPIGAVLAFLISYPFFKIYSAHKEHKELE